MKRTTRWLATLLVAGGAALAGTSQAKADLTETTTNSYFTLDQPNSDVTLSNNNQTMTFADTLGQIVLTFTGNAYSGPGPGPISLGTFSLSNSFGLGATIPNNTIGFQLQIDQTDPSVGSNTLPSTLKGTLTIVSNSLRLKFDDDTISVPTGPGGVIYSLQGLDNNNNFDLSYPTSTLYATVAIPAVPEPSTLAIAGIGALAGCGYGWRRRRRDAA
jgi:hypothetical protein